MMGFRKVSADRICGSLVLFGVFALFAIAVAQEPAGPKKPPVPLKVAPRAYFSAHCQRCHGIDGSNYEPEFAKKKTVDALRADIKRMAIGPGGAPLEADDLEVQVAYHQLISASKPFVSWTSREGLVLKGEVSDGAKLESNLGEVKVDDDSVWTLTLPSEADFSKLKLTATIEKEKIVFSPSESSFAKPEKEKPKEG